MADEGEADVIIVPNSWRDTPQLAANPKMRVWNAFIGMIGHDEDEERHTATAQRGSGEGRANKEKEKEKGVHFDEERTSPVVHNSGSGSKRKKSAGSQDVSNGINGKNAPRRR